jgi:hypothetical protein
MFALGPKVRIAVVAVALAGCGASQVVPEPQQASADSARFQTQTGLIYAASDKDIDVVSYTSGALVAKIATGQYVAGLCSDPGGHVYVSAGTWIFKYEYGGTSPVAKVKSRYGFPEACAFDPTTGNLAVVGSFDSGPENVAVYKNYSGKPTDYVDDDFYDFAAVTYDDSGDLFATDGFSNLLGELAAGQSKFHNARVTTRMKSSRLIGIQWDGKYLAVQEAPPSAHAAIIDRVTASSAPKVVSRARYDGKDIHFAWLSNGVAIGLEGGYALRIGLWSYPSGGSPLDLFGGYGRRLSAATLSLPPSR